MAGFNVGDLVNVGSLDKDQYPGTAEIKDMGNNSYMLVWPSGRTAWFGKQEIVLVESGDSEAIIRDVKRMFSTLRSRGYTIECSVTPPGPGTFHL